MRGKFLNEMVTVPRSRLFGLYGSNIMALGFLLVVSDLSDALQILGFVIAAVGLAMSAVAASMVAKPNATDANAR